VTADDQGSAAVEMAILAPALVALLLLVTLAGRVTTADNIVRRAAADGARAASLERTPAAARTAATDAVATDGTPAGSRTLSFAVKLPGAV
jgi:Flp pilus assembly protein TadG